MGLMIQKEFLTRSLIEEIDKYISEHQTEVKHEDDVNVDWLSYQVLQKSSAFYFYTARLSGELIGYMGYLVTNNLHYRDKICAICDLIYVRPEHRGKMCAIKLMKFAEEELSELGVSEVGQSVKIVHDFSPILIRQGYHLEERYYTKRIQ